MIKREEAKLKPQLKIADDIINLADVDTKVIVKQMEEMMQLRSEPIEKHIKKAFKR